jgi:hypothetical protein
LLTTDQILTKQGEEGVQLYRKSLRDNNRVVTGQTALSIKSTVKQDTLIFTGDDHITALEDGRKPTESGASGNGFFEQIEQWVLDRGIPIEAAYPIYRKINREGYKGTEGLLSIPSEEIINNTKKALIENMFLTAKTSFKTFKDK